MIPRVAKRGHSFKGAAQYYLHDKQEEQAKRKSAAEYYLYDKNANTNERVEWTYTHNLPTDDPNKAFGWMAYTAKHADELKAHAGVSKVGRKRKAGVVYTYSLSWHPEQNPEESTMKSAAMDVLERLGLIEHEAVIVAHNDTDHPHVHVVCNMVHPEHGRMAVPSYDFLTTSKWAQEQEEKEGKIYCEQRVINNEKRKAEAKQGRELALIKHKEKQSERALEIQKLYNQYDSGRAFQNAVQTLGYTLAKGDRRGFVLVDEQGKVHSLSRQLKGQRAKEIKARLDDVQKLPLGAELVEARKAHQDEQEKAQELEQKRKPLPNVTQDFDEAAQQKGQSAQTDNKSHQEHVEQKAIQPSIQEKSMQQSRARETYLKHLDALRAWEQWGDRRRDRLLAEQEQFYNRKDLLRTIRELEYNRQANNKWWNKLSGRAKEMEEKLIASKRSLEDMDRRMDEQKQTLEREIDANHPHPRTDEQQENSYSLTHDYTMAQERQQAIDQALQVEADELLQRQQKNEQSRSQVRLMRMRC